MEKLAEKAGILAALGGSAFAVFWLTLVLDVDVPWAVSLPFHAVAMLLLASGIVRLQIRQSQITERARWIWLIVILLVLSLPTSFEGFMVLTIVFASATFRLDVLPRSSAVIVGLGALMFLVGWLAHGPFWSENDPKPEGALAVLFGASLIVLALGWGTLGVGKPRGSLDRRINDGRTSP